MYTLKLFVTLILASTAVIAKPQSKSFFFIAKTTDQIYSAGSKAYLFVETSDGGSIEENDDWKTCTWTRKTDGSKCVIEYRCTGALCSIGFGIFSRHMDCDSSLKERAYFFGPGPNDRNNFCGIEISKLSQSDESEWECSLEQCRVTGCGTEDGDGTIIRTTIGVTIDV